MKISCNCKSTVSFSDVYVHVNRYCRVSIYEFVLHMNNVALSPACVYRCMASGPGVSGP